MTGFVDIHTHILPGLDDGAPDTEHGLKLLRMAYENGTRAVLFTPHYRGRYRANTPEQIRQRFQDFTREAAIELPDMQFFLGQEIYYDKPAAEALAEGRALAVEDTGYALLEFSPKSTQDQVEKGVEAFLYYGYRPIIVHAERYDILRKKPKLLDAVLAQGALLQLNADSILGKYGFGVKQFCHKVLKNGWASFVASDAHDLTYRPPVLRECFRYISKKYGEDYAHRLFTENPMAMLENEEI